MSTIPHFTETTIAGREVLIDGSIDPQADSITLDSSNTDAGSSPTHRFRPGNVVIYRTSTKRFVEANDANADDLGFPSITSSGHSDANGVIKLVGNHGTISVTTSTGTGTEANHATDLNADADFAAYYQATSGGGELTITARNGGVEEWFYIHSDTIATVGFAEGEDNGVNGTIPDVRVTADYADLQDEHGTAVHADVLAYRTGYFDESQLINLTAEAKAILASRGAQFA